MQYAVNGGALAQLTDAANTVSSTRAAAPAGVLLRRRASAAVTASFAGLYTTKRGAARPTTSWSRSPTPRSARSRAPPQVHEKYSFTTTADTAVPAGYTKNDGAAWTDATGIGWVTQASLATATHAPLNLTTNTRVRTRPAPVTALQNRLIHMQYGDVDGGDGTNGNKTAGAFERAVPNGWYQVNVSVGDQMGATAYDSQHTVNVEGVDRARPVPGDRGPRVRDRHRRRSRVTDGRLTIDAIGGTNTKLNYVEIDSTTAPVEPDVHAKVRFADEATAPPAGYLKDYGEAFGARTGADQGTGLTYGWAALATSSPSAWSATAATATRAPTPRPERPRCRPALMHMQLPDTPRRA